MTSAEGYAALLSDYDEKGKLNLRNYPDSALAVLHKARLLADMMRGSEHVVVHTGAGISTTAGIPDFRGPQGVWTLETRPQKRQRKNATADVVVPFELAMPTVTHLALTALHTHGHVAYVISQNVDGLHLRAGLPRASLSELHGNVFMERCARCRKETLRDTPAPTVGLQRTGGRCECGGELYDHALDWEDKLPEPDHSRAKRHASRADLSIVLGTSCQMEPARGLPFREAQGGAKAATVLVNLSETPLDTRFGMRIRAGCDGVLAVVACELGVRLAVFERRIQATFHETGFGSPPRRWSLRAASGGEAVGVRKVRSCEEERGGSGAAQVIVEFMDGRATQMTAEDGKTVEVEMQRKDRNTEMTRVKEEMVRRAKEADETGRVEEYFARGRRRGWSICCVCRDEVWCGRGKREAHVNRCISRERRRAALLREPDAVRSL